MSPEGAIQLSYGPALAAMTGTVGPSIDQIRTNSAPARSKSVLQLPSREMVLVYKVNPSGTAWAPLILNLMRQSAEPPQPVRQDKAAEEFAKAQPAGEPPHQQWAQIGHGFYSTCKGRLEPPTGA